MILSRCYYKSSIRICLFHCKMVLHHWNNIFKGLVSCICQFYLILLFVLKSIHPSHLIMIQCCWWKFDLFQPLFCLSILEFGVKMVYRQLDHLLDSNWCTTSSHVKTHRRRHTNGLLLRSKSQSYISTQNRFTEYCHCSTEIQFKTSLHW